MDADELELVTLGETCKACGENYRHKPKCPVLAEILSKSRNQLDEALQKVLDRNLGEAFMTAYHRQDLVEIGRIIRTAKMKSEDS